MKGSRGMGMLFLLSWLLFLSMVVVYFNGRCVFVN